jgi:hypothetical protein
MHKLSMTSATCFGTTPKMSALSAVCNDHRHLLGIGCIQEQSMSGQDALITVTDAGRKALRETS